MNELELTINKIAQNKLNFEDGKELILKNIDSNFSDIFELLQNYIFNSIPNKTEYSSETYQFAVKSIPLKSTFTPVIILTKFSTKIAFNKLRVLQKSEYRKIIISLLWIFKITDSKRRETECKNDCGHFWHNIE